MNKFTPKGRVKQVDSTILAPENSGLRLVLNLVGLDGSFKSDLDLMLAKKWSKVKENYREWFVGQHNFKLGSLREVAVASDTWVVNALVVGKDGSVDAAALNAACKKLGEFAKQEHASVHVSNMVADKVPALSELLNKYLTDNGINLYYYTEPQK